uniref:Uncharacterized protein n=1 Tax=Panagrolaimus sp. JU765 TaxID=591449 RepID=A0AC34PUM8_9BILA
MILKLFLFLTLLITTSFSMRCFTCDNESCSRGINGYVPVNCGNNVGQCYLLKNLNSQKVFKAGCLTMSCEALGNMYRASCSSCDSDSCNKPLQGSANVPAIGGGTTFNSAPVSSFSIVLFTILLVCLFL